jgi:hypothetical protein
LLKDARIGGLLILIDLLEIEYILPQAFLSGVFYVGGALK